MKKLVLGTLLSLVIHASAFAETSLWKVQSDDSVAYLGGTCHILRQSDYPLPKEFDRAYGDADIIVFETDLEKLNKPETQQIIVRKGMYTDGSTLDKILSPEAYDVLEKYCEKVGIPVSSLHPLKPSMVMLALLGLELRKLGVTETGVDLYFHQKATQDGKKTEALEMFEEHIDMVTSMGEGNESNFVMHSIADLKRTEEIINDVIDAWEKGDKDTLSKLFLEQMREDYSDLYETLFVERNQKWLSKIEGYLQTPEREFVLVGAGHLVGEDGIVEQLKNRGHKVEKLIHEE